MKDQTRIPESAVYDAARPQRHSPSGLRTSELMLLRLQRLAGNSAVTSLLAWPALQREVGNAGTPGPQAQAVAFSIQRCGPIPCDCPSDAKQQGGGVGAHAVAQRLFVQRDDPQDATDKARGPSGPGGPLDTNDQGFLCGTTNGQFSCSVDIGKGDPLQLPGDWSPWSGSPEKQTPGIDRPPECPPDRWNPAGPWNMYYGSCCGADRTYDAGAHKCVAPAGSDFGPLPPAPTPDMGDFPVPSPDTQVA